MLPRLIVPYNFQHGDDTNQPKTPSSRARFFNAVEATSLKTEISSQET